MTTPAPKFASYADLLALPEGVRGEVIAGELATAPAPLPRHAKVQGAARRFVGGPFDDDDGHGGPGGWWIFKSTLRLVRMTSSDLISLDGDASGCRARGRCARFK